MVGPSAFCNRIQLQRAASHEDARISGTAQPWGTTFASPSSKPCRALASAVDSREYTVVQVIVTAVVLALALFYFLKISTTTNIVISATDGPRCTPLAVANGYGAYDGTYAINVINASASYGVRTTAFFIKATAAVADRFSLVNGQWPAGLEDELRANLSNIQTASGGDMQTENMEVLRNGVSMGRPWSPHRSAPT